MKGDIEIVLQNSSVNFAIYLVRYYIIKSAQNDATTDFYCDLI